MTTVIKLCLIIFVLNIVKAQIFYYSDILECNYNFESDAKSKMLLTINGYKYRETVTQPNIDSYFAISVNSKSYNVSYYINGPSNKIPNLFCKYTQGLVLEHHHNNKDIVIKNNIIKLYQNEYFHNKKHILNVYLIISMQPFDINQKPLHLELYLNNNLIKKSTISNIYSGISYKLELEGYIGVNFLELLAYSDGIWCSCPSMFNGFDNSRYILTWLSNKNEENNSIGIITISERILIGINTRFNSHDIISI